MEKQENKKTKADKKENVHIGHRQRMREEFFAHGFKGMQDHEVLEMLLYFAIPQRNTNEIAHKLISYFGSFSAVLEADREELVKFPYISDNAACLFKMILPSYARYIESVSKRKPVLTNNDEIVEHLRPMYLGSSIEKVYVMCFDPNHHLLACRLISEGDISSADFDLRKLVSIILETKATSVVISHNHPHGITLPSRDDVAVTEKAYKVLKSLKVSLLDHIIVTETSYCSMVNMPRFAHVFYGLSPLFDGDED